VPLAIIAFFSMVSPFGLVIALVMLGILLTAHPTIAIALGGTLALVIIFALRERFAGRPF
jgi:hypothetical protein